MSRLSLAGNPLHEDAVPFVREFLLEVARSVPPSLGAPPRLRSEDLEDGSGCASAALELLRWMDTVPEDLDGRVGELQQVFSSLLAVVEQIDRKLHRAVHKTRTWIQEERAFARVLEEVLGAVREPLEARTEDAGAVDLVDRVVQRIRSRNRADRDAALELSTSFETVHQDLAALRKDVARLEERTSHLRLDTLHDGLTGLWNRHALDDRLAEELSRSRRHGSPLSIALWDVDRLGELNRAHGHRVGDLALQHLANRILALLRRSDFFARRGAGEFAVLFPNTEIRQSGIAAEKIRAAAASEPVASPDGPVNVTVSVGVASARPDDTGPSLLRRAEAALARAKASGRDRVETENGTTPSEAFPGP